MISFAGSKGSLKLFVEDNNAVVVDSSLNLVVGSGDASVLLSAREWDKPQGSVSAATLELASGAITTLDIKVITAAGGRAYSIPDGVKAEAKKALEWRKEHKRGGTPVGLNTARTLARGGQIGIEKVRHIAKYFARHEVDKKGKGWKPGQDNFPSNGRIAWALWGGDGAWRWAQAIVERENKKAVTATGYAVPGYSDSVDTYRMADAYDSNLDAFKNVNDLDPNYGPEFMARVRMDGSGIDRLYMVDINGKVCVWDDGRWDDLGHVDGDVWTYDNALDDPYDHCEKDHFVIDPESAIYISARMMQDPHGTIAIEDLDPDEANLFAAAAGEEDWSMSDYAMAASGALVAFIGADTGKDAKAKGAVKKGDGQYTSAERSSIATGAPRDATGKFAKAGGRAVVGGDRTRGAGVITGRSATPGNILFKSDVSGQVMDIPAKFTVPEAEAPETAPAPAANPAQGAPLDVSGILGEPRMAKGSVGQLPGTMEQLTPEAIGQALNDWGSYVKQARDSFTGKATDDEVRDYAKDTGQKIREVPTVTEGKATTLRDGKFVVQSVPSAPVSEDMNPDNAPAAAPSAAPAGGVGRASVPRMSGGPAPTPQPARPQQDPLPPKTMPAKPSTKPAPKPKTLPAKAPAKPAAPKAVPKNAIVDGLDKPKTGTSPIAWPKPKAPAKPAPKPKTAPRGAIVDGLDKPKPKPKTTPIPWPKGAPKNPAPKPKPVPPGAFVDGLDDPKKTSPIPWPKKPAPKPIPKPKPKPAPKPAPKPEPEAPEVEEPTTPPVNPEEPTTPTPEEPTTPTEPTDPTTPTEPETPTEPTDPTTPTEPTEPTEPTAPAAPAKPKPKPKPSPKPQPPKKPAAPKPPKKIPPGAIVDGLDPKPKPKPGPDAVERGTNTDGGGAPKKSAPRGAIVDGLDKPKPGPDAVERGTNTDGGGAPKPKPAPKPKTAPKGAIVDGLDRPRGGTTPIPFPKPAAKPKPKTAPRNAQLSAGSVQRGKAGARKRATGGSL
jgi:hypothetical protein